MSTEPPEPLIVGTAVVSTEFGFKQVRGIMLASCPGLLATEVDGRRGSWVITHGPSGLQLQDREHPIAAAPWAAAVRWLRELALLADWTLPAHLLSPVLAAGNVRLVPPAEGWLPLAQIEPRHEDEIAKFMRGRAELRRHGW